jgi:hypothetical protein
MSKTESKGGCGEEFGVRKDFNTYAACQGVEPYLVCGVEDGHCPACAAAYRALWEVVDEFDRSYRGVLCGSVTEALQAIERMERP